MKRLDTGDPRYARRNRTASNSKNSSPQKRLVKDYQRNRSPKPAKKRFAKEGAGGLPACASRKYKYYNAGGHYSPTPVPARSRNSDQNNLPRGHGGVYDSVYVSNVKAGDVHSHHPRRESDPRSNVRKYNNHSADRCDSKSDANFKMCEYHNPDAYLDLDDSSDSPRSKKSSHHVHKIKPSNPRSGSASSGHSSGRRKRSHNHTGSRSGDRNEGKKRRQMRRTNSEPNIRVLYRHDEDRDEDGFWVRLKRSQSDPDLAQSGTPILRKIPGTFQEKEEWYEATAADNLRRNKIRFDSFFSRVTFIMEDPYTTILCVEETIPLDFSDESEESTSSEVTSYSGTEENAKIEEDEDGLSYPTFPTEHQHRGQGGCSCTIS